MEVIRFGSANNRPPLLLVHGSYCGAWIWTRFFLPALAEAGWHGAAISLRGHGGSGGQERIDTFGLIDYLQDIYAGIRLFEREPVLIGHSMGGYLIQKWALDHPVRGLALLSSPSLLGLEISAAHIATREPLLAMQLGALATRGPKHTNMRVISDALFHDRNSAAVMESSLPLLQRESALAMTEMMWPDLRHPKNIPPTFILGGEDDAFVPAFEFRYEAQFWKTKAYILPDAPHGVMLDACWTTVFKAMTNWLSKNYSVD